MNLSEFSVNRPITTLMAILSIIVMGYISLTMLPLQQLPDISFPALTINVPYQSSSPQEIEKYITIPIEDEMSTLSHLKKISSTSYNNSARISLEFDQGVNMDLMAMEVRNRLEIVRKDLPSDVRWMRIWRFQPNDRPVIFFSVAWSGESYRQYDIIKLIERRIQRIEGVANVEIRGMDEKQILIDVNQNALKSYKVDIYNLASSIRTGNRNLSGGYIIDGGKKYTIRSIGEFRKVSEIADLPVKGDKIKLSDVADVRYDFPEKKRFQRLNGVDAITFQVRKSSVANIVEVCKNVKKVLNDIRKEIGSEKLNIRVFRDQSEEITKSLDSVWKAGILGAIFASLVLFFFLRKVRSTLIILIAIPISVICSFLFMYLMRTFLKTNITLNLVSLSGLMVSVGMLVDNGVVVLENIFRYKQEEGAGAKESAIKGSSEVSIPIIAATLTTIIVFIPLIFIQKEGIGQFMGDFGLVICVALIASLFIALTLIPLLSSMIFTGREKKKSKFLIRLSSVYKRMLEWTLNHRFITILSVLVIFCLSYYLFTKIEQEFEPPAPSREIQFNVEIPRSFSLEDVKNLFSSIEDTLLAHKDELDIDNISTNFGKSSSTTSMFLRGNSINISLKDISESVNESTLEVQEKIKKLLPEVTGVNYRAGRLHGMGGRQMGISIVLKGLNTDVLQVYAEDVKERLKDLPGIKEVDTSLERGEEEVRISVDRTRANKYGISSSQVAWSIMSGLSERATSQFKTPNGEVDINLRLREEDRVNVQQLKNMVFQNVKADMIPLDNVANLRLQRGPQAIQRESHQTIVTVYASTERMGMYDLRDRIAKRLASLKLPPGYSWELGSNWRMFRESQQASFFSILLAIALIYIVMASLFESYIHPFTILFSIPFALIGVFILFVITRTTFNAMSNLGILMLFGIVVNNGIILVDCINKYRRNGMPRKEAIIRGGQVRMRPILMTATTTILGLGPMVLPVMFPQFFGPIEGRAGWYGQVGVAIVGGLATSTFLTLVIVPTIYSVIDDITIWFKRIVLSV